MATATKTLTFTGFTLPKVLLYVVLTIFILLTWTYLGALVIIAAGIYMAIMFIKLAAGGFSCMHCYAKFFVSLAIFIFSFGALNQGSVLIPLVLLWLDGLMKGVHK
ncbi:MAG: hypothetical protein ACMXX9_03110 [Candidatus Woesearchaeota archaeon]